MNNDEPQAPRPESPPYADSRQTMRVHLAFYCCVVVVGVLLGLFAQKVMVPYVLLVAVLDTFWLKVR